MPTRYKVALFLITFLVIFLVKPTSSYAAELDHPPVVTSITGPTTGYYGQTYSFTTAATAGDGYTMTTLFLQNDGATFSSKSAGDSGCTGTSCSFTGSFTPPTTGTFIIHAAANYTNGVNSDTCNSYSEDAYMDCQNSGDKYITFTVLAAPTTPIVTSVAGPTSGKVGESYTFAASVISIESLPISSIVLRAGLESSSFSTILSEAVPSIDAGCSETSCSTSGIFTPTEVGTYRVFVATGTDDQSCNTFVTSGPNLCSYSLGKYITFVVTTTGGGQGSGDDTDLPSTGIFTNQTRNIVIGLGFISLGILTTQATKIVDILGLSSEKKTARRRSKLENRYK